MKAKFEIDKAVGQRIATVRKARGLTVAQLAAKTDRTVAQMEVIESGQASIHIARLYQISEALDIAPADLLPAAHTKVQR